MEISSEFLNYQEQVSTAVVRRLENEEKAGEKKRNINNSQEKERID